VAGSAPTVYCEVHGGHNLLTTTGSILSESLGASPKRPKLMQMASRSHPMIPTGRPNCDWPGPGRSFAQSGEKKKKILYRRFLVSLGVRRRNPTRLSLKPEKGDSP